MREELMRRGAMPRPGLPGLPPHNPYLEASRRYAAQVAGAGIPSPYGSKLILRTVGSIKYSKFK